MKNDVNFRENLIIQYLANLVRYDERSVFNEYYEKIQGYLQKVVENPESVEQLDAVRKIISYKKNEKVLEV